MNELALFAGAGGGILAGKLLGWKTVCAVERDAYSAEILAQRQNDGLLDPFPIWSDISTFNGYPWQGIAEVVSGGFPCQDISCAGSGAGITGSRSGLWKHMARIIGEVRPRYAFIENSAMLVVRGLDVVLCDLAAMGFDAEWGIVSAAEAGANHERKRIWILAVSNTVDARVKSVCGGENGIRQHCDLANTDTEPRWRWPWEFREKGRDESSHGCDYVSAADRFEHQSIQQKRSGQGQREKTENVLSNANTQGLEVWEGQHSHHGKKTHARYRSRLVGN